MYKRQLLYHIHAYAAAGELGDFGVGGKARGQKEIEDVPVGIVHSGNGQPLADGLVQNGVVVDALAVVLDLDEDVYKRQV